ncbi:MAG: polysaccharide biosynthesis tyrosine autokinase [Oculatellaceae cyanobacterium Prado106]|jgi:capsular exopolysaccharide synthesis family protein|nr:polysaccharide biosynthesis tyrosine autokinase [Oculatellaceae cyanobacterium Prado106]
MPENNLNLSNDAELGYGQLFSVLLRRRLWLIGTLCCVLPLAALLSLRKEPTYVSSMQLLVEPNYRRDSIGFSGAGSDAQLAGTNNIELDYATQIRLMQSSEVLERAVDLLRPEDPTLDVAGLQSAISINRVLETRDKIETNLLQVDYSSNDAKKTQKVLQVLQKVYLDYNLEQQEQRLVKGLSFINDQLPEANNSVAQAEKALEKFREDQNVIDPQQRAAEISQALQAIAEQRRKIRSDFQDSQAKFSTLQQQLARSPQSALVASRLSESPRYQALLNALQETELALALQRVTFTDDAPNVKSLLQKLTNQQQLLQQEASRIIGANIDQATVTSDRLQAEGQLGEVDRQLVSTLAITQSTILGLSAQDQSLAQAEQRLRSELNRFPRLISEFNRLQPEIETNRDTLQQLLRARQQLGIEIARGGFNWQVVESPKLGQKTGPNLMVDLLLGAIVGTFLGATAAFIREAGDDVIHSASKLRETVALPALGNIPKLPSAGLFSPLMGRNRSSIPILEAVNWLPFRESIDLIFKNIQLLQSNRSLKSIAITSSLEGEGKSTLAMAIALSAARLKQRVLIIDADLRFPSLHEKIKVSNNRGLTSLLRGDQDSPVLHRINNTDVLTSGPKTDDPLQLLSSAQMRDWMLTFQREYDLVILDCPPVLGMADAIQAASLCSGVVMVGRIDRVSQSELVQAVTAMGELNVIGIVANGADNPRSRYTGYVQPTVVTPTTESQALTTVSSGRS